MNAEVFKKIRPKAFYGQFLENSIRPDGRDLDNARGILISDGHIGTADGSSFVRLGGTGILCGLKLEFAPATDSTVTKGKLVISILLTPLCNSSFYLGRPTNQSKYYSEVLTQIFQKYVLDLSELYNQETGRIVIIHADLVCIDYEGSVLDACCLALLSALLTLRIPKLSLKDNELSCNYDDAYALTIMDYPVSITFGLYNEFEVMDPDGFEESILDDTVTMVLGTNNRIISILKPGGKCISEEALTTLREKARERYDTVYKSIEEFKYTYLKHMEEE